jgi:hypothetical protein
MEKYRMAQALLYSVSSFEPQRTTDMKRLFALVLLAMGFASSAHADLMTWTDSADITGESDTIHMWQSATYKLDLTKDGFNAATDTITAASLSIEGLGLLPIFEIKAPGKGPNQSVDFEFSNSLGDWFSYTGTGHMSALGLLSLTITSIIGNFTLYDATLTAHGERIATSVPEPGALGLMGLGLVGMVVGLRRRKQAIR